MALGVITFSKKLEILARFCGAYALILGFILADLIAFQIPYFQNVRPCFTVMALFYWSIYRPTLMPTWLAFIIGILIDLLSGLPVGMNAMSYVIVQYLVSGQRKMFMGQPFISVFFGYALVSGVVVLLQWIIFGIVTQIWVPVLPVFGMGLLGIAFFPIALLMMNATHKILPIESSAMGRGSYNTRIKYGNR